jgi:hypothetical protein
MIQTFSTVLPITIVMFFWWLLYFFNLIFKRNAFKMPQFYLHSIGFFHSIAFYLNYEIELILYGYFEAVGFGPLALVIRVVAVCFPVIVYPYVVNYYTIIRLPFRPSLLCGLFFCAWISLVFVIHDEISYITLQLLTTIIIGAVIFTHSLLFLQLSRQNVLKKSYNAVQQSHLIIEMMTLLLSHLVTLFMIIDALHKIFWNIQVIDTPLWLVSQLIFTISMIIGAILYLPDHIVYRIYYPFRLRTFYKLQRLSRFINYESPVDYKLPITNEPNMHNLELLIYRQTISIFSKAKAITDHNLRIKVMNLNHPSLSYEESLTRLVTLSDQERKRSSSRATN